MEKMTLKKKNKIKEKSTSMIPYRKSFLSLFQFSEDAPNTRVVFSTSTSSTPNIVTPLDCLPYFRTYEGTFDEPSTLNLGFCLQKEEINVRHKEDQKDLVPSGGFFPYYRSQDEFLVKPLLRSRLCKAHRTNSRNEEKGGDSNRELAIHNYTASLLGLKPNFDLQSLPKNSPRCRPLVFSSETSEESQLDVPLFNDDATCSAGFVSYYRSEEPLQVSPIPIILSSVPRGHEWDGTEVKKRNWIIPTYFGVSQKHSKS
ncbi:uncharacterized protein LOC110211680 [Phascolarctos cinereus]|uniref:Uncharacterized protein LOC110211680 n=1 Tax=Phascolarctos cinereus TaxID=38626 RepID=A0A6P5KPT5_PHACI|nr:uncharacterized protein LOC110211680 [Phascolarctos cinereus]